MNIWLFFIVLISVFVGIFLGQIIGFKPKYHGVNAANLTRNYILQENNKCYKYEINVLQNCPT